MQALTEAAAALSAAAKALQGQAASVPKTTLSFSPSLEPLTVAEAINEFLRAKARAGRSDRYLRQLRLTLNAFAKGRNAAPLAAVTTADVDAWLEGSGWAARTRRSYLGDVQTLCNWCVRRGLLAASPSAAVELPQAEPLRPSIHTPAEASAALELARKTDPDLCRTLALRYFAGLRSAEAARLAESDLRPGWVEVPAAKAKTRRRRLVAIQPALAAWLALPGQLPLHDVNIRQARLTAALARQGIAWPPNVTRHSFCSYHLAAFGNAARTALEAGHSEAMLFGHYRELVTPDQAAEFWAIRPR